MTVRECIVRGSVASEHIVQFFDSDESRAECVAEFLAEGIANGEPVIIVAKAKNWAATLAQLNGKSVPVQRAIDDGLVVVKDADETLRRICRNGVPDASAFETVVGKAVGALALRGGRVRAYGEMVDMLAEHGELTAAMKLETLWNRLGERTPFLLLCGYAAAHFVETSTHRALRDICSAHSTVHRHSQDPLASWLLTTAHNSAASSLIH